MDFFNQILPALLIGILEGLTEFLPVSSTGHIILATDILGFKTPPGKVFEVVIQLGSILAVCWLYRARLLDIATTLHKKQESRAIAAGVTISVLPALILGAAFHGYIKEHLFNPVVVGIMLAIGGVIIIAVEKYRKKSGSTINDLASIPIKIALLIGLIQCLALIPGVSRSGATIIGSLVLGLNRKTAAEFSFFLAIPTIFAASAYDLMKNFHELGKSDALIIGVGFISAFISGFIVVKWLIRYIARHDFTVFGYYRIAVGLLILAFYQTAL